MDLYQSSTNGDSRSRASDFVINRDSRIPLFTTRPDKSSPPLRSPSLRTTTPRSESFRQRAAAATAIPRPSSAASVGSKSSNASGTPRLTTRIPRPVTTGPSRSPYRPPLTLIDAYRMAEEEEERRERGTERGGSPFGPDASPSPAPRPWLARHSTDEAKLRKLLNQDPQDMREREARLGDRRRSHIPVRPGSSASSTSSDRRTSEGARVTPGGNKAGLFAKSKVGPNVAKTGAALARKASNSSLDASFRSPNNMAGKPATKPLDNAAWMKRFMERDDEPIDAGFSHSRSGLMETRDASPGPPDGPSTNEGQAAGRVPSPDKSYAWQVDAEFTAGDIQVSDSPRIRFDSDELGGQHQRMAQPAAEVSDSPYKSEQKRTPSRPLNTKLDEIMEREALVEEEFPLPDHQQDRAFDTKLDEFMTLEQEVGRRLPLPDATIERPRNTKLDEIKAREDMVLSRKALASSKLDEIRERNSQYRPKPPSTFHSPKGKVHGHESTAFFDAEPEPEPESESEPEPESEPERRNLDFMEGERIPNTPVTIYRSKSTQERQRRQISPMLKLTEDTKHRRAGSSGSVVAISGSGFDRRSARDRSRDLFRRLDHGVSRPSHGSPAPESRKEASGVEERKERTVRPEKLSSTTSTSTSHNQPHAPTRATQPTKTQLESIAADTIASSIRYSTTSNARKLSKAREAKEPGQQKPSVGFAGTRRAALAESTQAKRISMTQSDGDPTERIEREMQLFAPADNQSEKGSVRARSENSGDEREEDEDKIPEEATPRPKKKQNILSMPTPRVTGAYVETPATVKVERRVDDEPLAPAADVMAQSDKAGGTKQRRVDRHADKGAGKGGESESEQPKDKARPRSRRRSKSGSKHRVPLLNTAKPPTVKDDLIELQHTHNIEDSTLDEFGDLLVNAPAAEDSTLDDLFEGMTDSLMEDSAKVSEQLRKRNVKSETALDRGIDMDAIDRMAKSLQTGLMGIRSAKQGIERLEGKVSHAEADAKRRESKKDDDEAVKIKVEPKVSMGHRDQNHPPKDTSLPMTGTAPAYILLPVPRLYRRSPFRLTTLGRLLLFLALWWTAEYAMCWKYCRPDVCYGTPCRWDPDDPPFGYVIPRKLDEWTTGGRGRIAALRATEEVEDLIADAWDYATGTDIRKIKQNDLDFDSRQQWRRRMRKKGFVKPRVETPEQKARWDAWREARLANEARVRARGKNTVRIQPEVAEEEEEEEEEHHHRGSESMNDDETLE